MSEAIDSNEIKVVVDSISTEEDYISLQEYRKEKESGTLTSHEALKKELGVYD